MRFAYPRKAARLFERHKAARYGLRIDKTPKSPAESKGFLDNLTAGFTMPYTLGQAAKACGRTKPTILNAINGGRLSASRDERGQWQIDPAELARVYPPKAETVSPLQPETAQEVAKIKLLEEKIKLLEQVVNDLQEDKKAARADVLQWQGVAAHFSEQLKQLAPPTQEGGAIIDADQQPAQKAAGGQRGGFLSFFWPWF